MSGNPHAPRMDADTIGAEASRRSGVPAEYLDGFLEVLAAASSTGRRPDSAELERCRTRGTTAATQGVPVRALVSLYLTAAEAAWPHLPGIADAAAPSRLRGAAGPVLAALNRAVVALCEGYEEAEDRSLALEEAARREFVDDLLYGRGDIGDLAARAEQFGLRLAGSHLVTVARAERPFTATDPTVRAAESALTARFGARNILISTREGLLICVTPGSLTAASGEFTHHVRTTLGGDRRWRVGIGRPHIGPSGIVRSFEEARDAIEFADRLELPARVLNAAELLVFPVLLRDRAAITDLVSTVLGPLREARGGPGPMLETLRAFFACHGNNAAAARRLHVSVRTVTYRLERIRRLTGYTPTDPTQRFTLETAVVGAQLLGWPEDI